MNNSRKHNNLIAVDIGNTTIEFAFMREGEVIKKIHHFSKELNFIEIEKSLLEESPFELKDIVVLISSVVKDYDILIKNLLNDKFSLNARVLKANKYDMLIDTNGRDINTIGMDILCKSAWAAAKNKTNTIIIDIGTATVMQYLHNKVLLGVAITCGINLLYKKLSEGTSLLPALLPQKSEKVLGTNTQEAIYGGNYWGYLGLLKGLIKKAQSEVKIEEIYITGGMSYLIQGSIEEEFQDIKFIYDGNLIFKGINILYEANYDKIQRK